MQRARLKRKLEERELASAEKKIKTCPSSIPCTESPLSVPSPSSSSSIPIASSPSSFSSPFGVIDSGPRINAQPALPYQIVKPKSKFHTDYHVQEHIEGERKFRARLAEANWRMTGPYKNTQTPVDCECPFGHVSRPRPSQFHIQQICRFCEGTDKESCARTFNEIVTERGGTVMGPYVKNNLPVECICKNKHKCSPSLASLKVSVGICGTCSGSIAEQHFGKLLRKLGHNPEPGFCIPEVRGKKDWPFDFKVGNCILEFDGEAHFKPVEVQGGVDKFKNYQRPRDIDKTRGALAYGYRMIRVHYKWILKPEEEQLKFLRAALKSRATLVVSCATRYQWLEAEGFCPTELCID